MKTAKKSNLRKAKILPGMLFLYSIKKVKKYSNKHGLTTKMFLH